MICVRFRQRGQSGAVGDMTVEIQGGESFTPPPYGVRRAGPNRLRQTSPGGGGWGNPFERLPELVLRDVRDGLVSKAAAEKVYGVVLSADGRAVDAAATAHARGTVPAEGRSGTR